MALTSRAGLTSHGRLRWRARALHAKLAFYKHLCLELRQPSARTLTTAPDSRVWLQSSTDERSCLETSKCSGYTGVLLLAGIDGDQKVKNLNYQLRSSWLFVVCYVKFWRTLPAGSLERNWRRGWLAASRDGRHVLKLTSVECPA